MVVWSAICKNKVRVTVILIAIFLASAGLSLWIHFLLDVRQKMTRQLRTKGPNFVIIPVQDILTKKLQTEDIAKIMEEEIPDAEKATIAYGTVQVADQKVIMAGIPLKSIPWLFATSVLEGNFPSDSKACIVGSSLARLLDIKVGESISVTTSKLTNSFLVNGIITTGSSEDHQLIVDSKKALQIIEKPGFVGYARMKTSAIKLKDMARRLHSKFPSLNFGPIYAVTQKEETLFRKIELLIAWVALGGLFCLLVSLTSTFTTMMNERLREIALMSALGINKQSLSMIFVCEAIVLALFGAILGYGAGFIGAHVIEYTLFQSNLAFNLLAMPCIILATVLVVFIAVILPLRRILKIQPAAVLKGE